MSLQPLRVLARLEGCLAGEPPRLDALLEWTAAEALGRHGAVHRPRAKAPAPPQGEIPIPLERAWAGRWLVARCSDPILGEAEVVTVERISKRIDVGNALLVAPEARQVITATSKGWMQRRWLPRMIRRVAAVAWLCVGDADGLRRLLRGVHAIGKEVAHGHGRIADWEVAPIAADWSWFAPGPEGPVLMRCLPADHVESDFFEGTSRVWTLPRPLFGARTDYAACVPPYWHPERYTEVVALA